ncbi:MAG: cytochrome-c peroxidase [Acidobacteriota bacterium]
MLRRVAILLLAGAAVAVAVDIPEFRLRMFKPLPQAVENPKNPITPEKEELGRVLYYENRISKSHKFSCNSCHKLDQFGVDNEPTSEGHRGQRGDRNSPTVYNAAVHFAQFWDGRAADVEEQAKGPILNPVEMAMPDEKTVVATLKSMPQYVRMFQNAFPQDKEPVNYENMARAIGAFERKLMTPSRWDRFLQGDKTALNDSEKAGFLKFVETGCATCHMGACAGGTMYQKLGVVKPYPGLKDEGRAKVTKRAEDRFFFKVPGLRNIEKTWPYFHDGSVKTLDEAVKLMAEYELGKNLSAAEVASIVTWLKTLTGEIPRDYVKPPALPPSTAKTPKPSLTD